MKDDFKKDQSKVRIHRDLHVGLFIIISESSEKVSD